MTEKIFQKRSWVFKTGVGFVIFWSFVIGFFNIAVLYLFGIPILALLLGIILVWVSKEIVKTKLLLTFIPIPIILLSFFLFYLLLPKAEPETFLILQNFRGQFVIIFDEPCGQPINYENERRIYRIPNDGILITNSKKTMGVIDRKFYLVDENGNQTEMPEFHWSKFEEEQKDWHWAFSKTKLSKSLVGVFWAYRRDFSFIIWDYYSLEAQDKQIKEEKQKLFQNTLDSQLKNCRESY
ncbi:MAG TPA: hypothetical protein VNI84_12655 [Pyrinomonadaceae bacterium]|nr:hypothetical protein [Pyrinomonadaceae bacterium]